MPKKTQQPLPERIGLHFGAISDPIKEQLEAQKLRIPKRIRLFQRMADSITLLGIHDIITDKERDKARQRLINKMYKETQDEARKELKKKKVRA